MLSVQKGQALGAACRLAGRGGACAAACQVSMFLARSRKLEPYYGLIRLRFKGRFCVIQ